MTAPGSTTVYRDSNKKEFISEKLADDKLAKAKDRFIGNLDKQSYEKELLMDAVLKHVPDDFKNQVKSNNIIDFLKT